MPGLSTYKPVVETCTLSNGHELTIRGLSVSDISLILHTHAEMLQTIFDQQKAADLDVAGIATVVATQAPSVAGAFIAYATGEPEHIEAAMRIPFTDQVNLLVAIAALTFKSQEELGKAVAVVVGMMQQVTTAAESYREGQLASPRGMPPSQNK